MNYVDSEVDKLVKSGSLKRCEFNYWVAILSNLYEKEYNDKK